MDENNSKALAYVRLERAKELLDEANKLVEDNSLKSANNRADTENFKFDVYWENEKTAEVSVEASEVLVHRIIRHPAKQIFAKDRMTRYEFGNILRSRCWDERRKDMPKLLSLIGVDEYNPYKICRKTHGCMVQDHIWFLYEGEQLTYEEVKGLK